MRYELLPIFFLLAFTGNMIAPTSPSDQLLEEFDQKFKQYEKHVTNTNYGVLVDYSLPLYRKRLWIIDLQTREVVQSAHVTHGDKSGRIYAQHFSNIPETHKSSLGAMLIAEKYVGSFGPSIRVDGLEKGINDKVRQRAIVFHSYHYLILWSWGCFITTPSVNQQIREKCSNGGFLWVAN